MVSCQVIWLPACKLYKGVLKLNILFLGDGKVNKDEFVAHWQDGTAESDANAGWLFTQMDTDKDGFFGSQAERDDVFNGFDDNGKL